MVKRKEDGKQYYGIREMKDHFSAEAYVPFASLSSHAAGGSLDKEEKEEGDEKIFIAVFLRWMGLIIETKLRPASSSTSSIVSYVFMLFGLPCCAERWRVIIFGGDEQDMLAP